MPVQTADIIDLQAYRTSRSKQADHAPQAAATPSFALQPVLMWVPIGASCL